MHFVAKGAGEKLAWLMLLGTAWICLKVLWSGFSDAKFATRIAKG